MVPIMPSDFLIGGYELICCGFTLAAAILSYLFMLR
jgi:hypothetical protein